MKWYRLFFDRQTALRFTFYAASLPSEKKQLPSPNHFFHRLQAWIDPRLLLLWLFIIPAVTPLIQPTITESADGLLHIYRLVALEHAIEQGAFFPRWLPDLAYGYGFPLFVFYAPLSYYVTLALSAGSKIVVAFNISFMVALLLSGTGTFLFVKDRFGPDAALLAGVAYVYAPFQLFNSFSRGGLPAAWAMALYPFVFWAFGRLLWPTGQTARTIWVPITALILGLALLTHNTLTLLFFPVLLLYLIIGLLTGFISGWRQDKNDRASQESATLLGVRQIIIPLGLALALGIGLAAFFLLPAVFEQQFAQVHRVITSPDFDFRFNFVTLSDLVSFPEAANTGLLNPEFPLTLGVAQILLAVIGCLACAVRFWQSNQSDPNPPQIAVVLLAVVILIGAVFMMLPISQPLWERLPFLEFTQFPHRMLGPAAFMLAILAGTAIAMLPDRFALWLMPIGLGILFFTAVPLLYPRYNSALSSEPTLLDMMVYEHRSGVIGSTSFGEYLPIWVENIPRESPLEPMYQANSTIERLDATYLPSGAVLVSSQYGFNTTQIVIDSPEPFQAIFHTFYFPGWSAQIDNRPVPTTPFSERGLIRLDVPAGRHEIRLNFQNTLIRWLANGISIVSLVLIVGFLSIRVMRSRYSVDDRETYSLAPSPLYSSLIGMVLLAAAFILLKTLYFDNFDTALKHTFDGTTVTGVDVSRQVNFGNQIQLLGYDLPQMEIEPGQAFDLTAYWQARQPTMTPFSALAQLVDVERHLYAGQDNLHPGGLPVTDWQPWGFVHDAHPIFVPFGTPPGDYFLTTGLYDPLTWQRLPVLEGGDPEWPDVIAIPVTIKPSTRPPTLTELNIQWPHSVDLNHELQLLGATPERDQIIRNDFLRVALFWETKAAPTENYVVALQLVDAQGNIVLEQAEQPSYGRYPTRQWSAGERVRDNHALWIPEDFPSANYRLQVQLVKEDQQTVGQWIDLGTLKVAE
ncbi:MAG: hypothetical protein KDJ65_10445 [Anaerolineae bacterium]|nr:hypothetical protein [Anaerolineae bacterium]